MENQSKKKKEDIDESLLMSMMAGDNKKPEEPGKPPREPIAPKIEGKYSGRRRRTAEADFIDLFFKNPDTNARNGKSVYIRPAFHERLTRIVQVIGEDKLTIYAYLDNILEHHFQEFGDQITQNFNDKYKPIL